MEDRRAVLRWGGSDDGRLGRLERPVGEGEAPHVPLVRAQGRSAGHRRASRNIGCPDVFQRDATMGSLPARVPILVAALAVLAAPPAAAASGVQLTRIASVTQPTYVAQPQGDSHRLYLTEHRGRVLVLRDGQLMPQPLLDLSRGAASRS